MAASPDWVDMNNEADVAAAPAASSPEVDALAADMKQASIETKQPMSSGINPADATAQVEVKNSIYQSASTFEDLKLSEALLKGVYAMGFTKPSKIQAHALPGIMSAEKPNVIAQAHHGSGKTATYALGMLSHVDPTKDYPQAVCICPTRELANQVAEVVGKLGQFTTIKCFLAVQNSERRKITEQIVVGTPGTMLAKIRSKERELDCSHVTLVVIDEADEMLKKKDEGLTDQTINIKKVCNRKHQVLLFSATYPDQVEAFANATAPRAIRIKIKREELSLDQIAQFYIDCTDEEDKYKTLHAIYSLLNMGQSIIFVASVANAKELTNRMRKDKFTVALLHGQMRPEERDVVMNDFRTGTASVLITTNVLSRGIDVMQVTLVINYDIPMRGPERADPETYIHRIGRSGRFGRKGVAINLVHDQRSRAALQQIATYYKKNVDQLPKDDHEKIEELVKAALAE